MTQTTIKLDGKSLESAKNYRKCVQDMQQALLKLQQEFAARQQAVQESFMEEVKAHWDNITVPNGIDPNDSWHTGCWALDVSYLDDHGLAFLQQRPDANPSQQPQSASMASTSGLPN